MSDNSAPPAMQQSSFGKEGLQGAIEFTKLLIALAGGAIAFLIQPLANSSQVSDLVGGLSLITLLCFLVSVGSGLIVVSAISVLLAHQNYDVENRYAKIPGLFNVISFIIGYLLLVLTIAANIFEKMR